MPLATYWMGDTQPTLTSIPGFTAGQAFDLHEIARINHISHTEAILRRNDGHRPYITRINGQAVAYGWVATRKALIGELNLSFDLTPDDRYLWDFATLPDWQGRGIYPHLLQTIIEREGPSASRLWIIHAPENLPSGAGMYKAGFEFVGQLSFTLDGSVGLAPYDDTFERARLGADLLRVPLIDSVLAPCWRCGGMTAKHPDFADADSCWPPKSDYMNPCSCAIAIKPLIRYQVGIPA